MSLALDEQLQAGEPFLPPGLVGIPGPTRQCLQPAGAPFSKRPAPISLSGDPAAELESFLIAVRPRDPAMSFTLDEVLKTGEPFFPVVLIGGPGPTLQRLKPMNALITQTSSSPKLSLVGDPTGELCEDVVVAAMAEATGASPEDVALRSGPLRA